MDAEFVKSRERLGSLGQTRLEAVVPSGKGMGGVDADGRLLSRQAEEY